MTAHEEPRATTEWPDPTPLVGGFGPEFPLHYLPEPHQAWVASVAEAVDVPVALAAMLEIVVVGAALAQKVVAPVTADWNEPPNIWFVGVMDSAERKGTTLRHILREIREWEGEAHADATRFVAEYEARVRTAENALRAAERDGIVTDEVRRLAGELAELHQKPVVFPRFTSDDVTPEALARILRDQRGHTLIASDEGGIFDVLAGGRYNPNNVSNLDLYLKSFTGEPYTSDRVSSGTIHIPRPLLSQALCVQHQTLHDLAAKPGFRARGVIGRTLFAVPDTRVGFRSCQLREIDTQARARRGEALRKLLDQPVPVSPYKLAMTSQAREYVLRVLGESEARLRPGADLAHMRDFGGRVTGYVVRLAIIMHAMEHSAGDWPFREVDEGHVARAWAMMDDFLIPHAIVANAVMGGQLGGGLAQRVVAKIIREEWHSEFTRKQVQDALKVKFVDDLKAPLDLLCEKNILRDLGKRETSGRPGGPFYLANPKLFDARWALDLAR